MQNCTDKIRMVLDSELLLIEIKIAKANDRDTFIYWDGQIDLIQNIAKQYDLADEYEEKIEEMKETIYFASEDIARGIK